LAGTGISHVSTENKVVPNSVLSAAALGRDASEQHKTNLSLQQMVAGQSCHTVCPISDGTGSPVNFQLLVGMSFGCMLRTLGSRDSREVILACDPYRQRRLGHWASWSSRRQ
jgi:hypothetical protein